MAEQLTLPGLNVEPSRQFQKFRSDVKPLDRLEDSNFHDPLRDYFVQRLTLSENRMQQFYSRWRANEKKMQAYIDLPDYEKLLEQMNKDKKAPSPVSITFPYAYANAWTVVTYMLHTFCGRKPIFQIGASKAESVKPAMHMERLIQWNADTTRLVRHLFQFFMDGQTYGVGALKTLWKTKYGMRSTFIKPQGLQGIFASLSGNGMVRQRQKKLIYEGNEVEAIDPFMFFPDPNVPMAEVNKKGEYVFWRTFVGKHELLTAEASGQIKYVSKCQPVQSRDITANWSTRSDWLGGDSNAARMGGDGKQIPYFQFDQGSVIVIPRELGLGESSFPERWLVGIVNKRQIVQLEPLDVEFDMHPVAVSEPNTMGYGFGQAGLVDFVGPIQDTLSWLLNSHIHNVRAALNNSFVFDPSMIEMQDLKNPEPGKLIRLKRAAIGQDVRQAIMQLNVQDVTQQHMMDLQIFQRVADTISGVSDNIRGLQDSGGRKTATEVRTSSEAGASRLAAQSRLVSAQGITDLTEQMSLNLQAKLSQEVYLSVLGSSGLDSPIQITPESIVGDFYYPTHDGTLPLDRVALFDTWKEILLGIAQDQELRGSFSVPKIFEFVAKLGGADNIESFKVQVAPEPPASAIPAGMMR